MNLQAQQPKKNNERNPKTRLNSKQIKAEMKTSQVIHETIQNGSKQELMDYAMPLQDNKATQLLHKGWVQP
jgi:hypothetical protein